MAQEAPAAATRWQITALVDGWGRELGREVLRRAEEPESPSSGWSAHRDLLDAGGWLSFSIGSYLLRGAGRTVLVDLGAGRLDSGQYRTGALLSRLGAQGVAPGQVTDVVFTHLHFDHVGWASQRGVVQFPQATHHVREADWEALVRGERALPGGRRKLAPIEPQVRFVGDNEEILSGLRMHAAPGHTPGHAIIEVGTDPRTWLIGDLAHVPFELEEEGWGFSADQDAELAGRSRRAFAERVAGSGEPIFAAHFPELRPGVLEPLGAGRLRWRYL